MEEKIRQIVRQELDRDNQGNTFNVSSISFHKHTGTDSPKIRQGDLILNTTSEISLNTINNETLTLDTIHNINYITLNGIATNGLGQKASINGNAQLGNCFKYAQNNTNLTHILTTAGSENQFLQSFNTVYIDTTSLAKMKVGAGIDHLIYVQDDLGNVVAQTDIIQWTGSSIVFKTTLATNWQIYWFLSMS